MYLNMVPSTMPNYVPSWRLLRPVRLPFPVPRPPQRASGSMASPLTLYVPLAGVSTSWALTALEGPGGRRHVEEAHHLLSWIAVNEVRIKGSPVWYIERNASSSEFG
jgi:hypothetical protein